MPVVASDTSPLRALAHLESMGWLEVLFQRVVLPPAVANELAYPPLAYQKVDVSLWSYLEVRPPENASRVAELRTELDAGEAEAIALAEEIGAELVLVDELVGREIARRCGFIPLCPSGKRA